MYAETPSIFRSFLDSMPPFDCGVNSSSHFEFVLIKLTNPISSVALPGRCMLGTNDTEVSIRDPRSFSYQVANYRKIESK